MARHLRGVRAALGLLVRSGSGADPQHAYTLADEMLAARRQRARQTESKQGDP